LMIAVIYFYKTRQINEKQEVLQRHKNLLRKLFLIYGTFCIAVLLASIWIAS
jgi:hypothetical protein